MNDLIFTMDNGKLKCKNLKDNTILTENSCIKVLLFADQHVNKHYIQGNNLIIRNHKLGYNIVINYFTQFYLSKYRDTLSNTIAEIRANEAKIQQEKHKGKKISNNHFIAKVGVAVAPVVLVSMLATSSMKKDSAHIDNINTLEKEKIENVIALEEQKSIDQELQSNQKINEDVAVDNNFEKKELKLPNARLDIEDNSRNEDIILIQQQYGDLCVKAGNKWGISPDILIGLLTQESHGNETNLMQIEYDAWKDQILNVYNYEDDNWIKVVLTDHPQDFNNCDIRITKEELNNEYTNVATAAMLLNHSINLLNTTNIFAVLEYYNKGHGNFYTNMNAYENATNKSIDEVLASSTDTSFIDYSYVCDAGDPNYVCNVMRYVPNKSNGGIYFYRIVDGEPKLVNINLNNDLNNSYVKNTR